MGAEIAIDYPPNLEVVIDSEVYLTSGAAIVERLPGSSRSRTWVQVTPLTSNGHRLSRTRLVAEEGVPALRQRAERQRHLHGK